MYSLNQYDIRQWELPYFYYFCIIYRYNSKRKRLVGKSEYSGVTGPCMKLPIGNKQRDRGALEPDGSCLPFVGLRNQLTV